jgi:hypothetical protein
VQGAQSVGGGVRAAPGLTLDGDAPIGFGVAGRDGIGDPVLEATLKGLGLSAMSSRRMQLREGMPLGRVRIVCSQSARLAAQR